MSTVCRFSLISVMQFLHQCQKGGRLVVNIGQNLVNVVKERPLSGADMLMIYLFAVHWAVHRKSHEKLCKWSHDSLHVKYDNMGCRVQAAGYKMR